MTSSTISAPRSLSRPVGWLGDHPDVLLALAVLLWCFAWWPTFIPTYDGSSMYEAAVAMSNGRLNIGCGIGVPGADGQCFSNFYPLQSFLAAPIVAFFDFGGSAKAAESAVHLIPAAAAAGSAVLARRIALDWGASPRSSWIAPVALIVGTELAVYSRSFFAESMAAFMTTLLVWSLLRPRGRSPRALIALASSGLVLAKPQLVFLAIAVVLVGGWRSRPALLAGGLGIAIATAVHGLHNLLRFDSVTSFGSDGGEKRHLDLDAFAPDELLEALGLFTLSPGRGLLVYSPVVALGLVLALVRTSSRTRALVLATVLGTLFVALINPGAGVNWGTRYLVPLMPLACAALPLARGALRAAAGVLVAWGALVHLPVLIVAPESAYREPTSAELLPREIYWSWTDGPALEVWKVLGEGLGDTSTLFVWWRELPTSARPGGALLSLALAAAAVWLIWRARARERAPVPA